MNVLDYGVLESSSAWWFIKDISVLFWVSDGSEAGFTSLAALLI